MLNKGLSPASAAVVSEIALRRSYHRPRVSHHRPGSVGIHAAALLKQPIAIGNASFRRITLPHFAGVFFKVEAAAECARVGATTGGFRGSPSKTWLHVAIVQLLVAARAAVTAVGMDAA